MVAQGSMLRYRLPVLRCFQQAGIVGAGVVREGFLEGVGRGLECQLRLGQVEKKGRLVSSLGVMQTHVPGRSD